MSPTALRLTNVLCGPPKGAHEGGAYLRAVYRMATNTDKEENMNESETEQDTAVPAGSDYVSNRDFADFPISTETLKGIQDLGFVTATPVQAASIEPGLAGKDMVVRAKTGTGKTAAFVIPMLERIEDGSRRAGAIVLAPTRELAQQTAEQAEAISKYRDVSVATLVGGMAMGPQETALQNGAELIVGTPGRILDHIRRGNLDLSAATQVCLDEADEMLSMGFLQDVMKIIDSTCEENRNILLFSATLSPDIQRIVSRYMEDPEEIMLSSDTDGVDLIDHVIYETTPGFHKVRSLLYLLDIEDPHSAIIFCNTREDTATVATYLDRQGMDVQLISGELSQGRRSAVMHQVKSGEVRFLVATDVAARGIDISDLSHVVNYSLPFDPSVYLHRTGRTGRIGNTGTAISLVGGADLNTRRMLETRHNIEFKVKMLPDAETCVAQRVERQAAQIKSALGSMVFESYLPTVRAIMERPDRDMLLAATLRAFFQWDRTRRAAAAGNPDSVGALQTERAEKREDRKNRDGGRGRGRRDRDGGERGDRKERGRDRGRGERKERSPKADILDLDTLLVSDDGPPPAGAGDTDGEKKKRRRKRKRKTVSPDAGEQGQVNASSSSDGTEASAPTPAKARPLDDLDSLLSFDE